MASERQMFCEATAETCQAASCEADDRATEASGVESAPVKKMKKEGNIEKMQVDGGDETDHMLLDESFVFVSRGRQVTESPGMKEHTIELRQPCKECPELIPKEKEKAEHELVAQGRVYVVSRRFVQKCVAARDYVTLAEMFDEYSQSTHDWMHYCTNLEGGLRVRHPSFFSMTAMKGFDKKVEAFVKHHGVYRGYPSRPGIDEMKGCVLVDTLCLTQKRWAGRGYGTFLLNAALKKLMPGGSIGPVYLKPYPLQWSRAQQPSWRQVFTGEDPAGPDGRQFTEGQIKEIENDTYKLVEHYRKCGFVKVSGSNAEDEPYFVRSAVRTFDIEMSAKVVAPPTPANQSTPSMAETPKSTNKKRHDVCEARSSKKRKVNEGDDNNKNLVLQPGVRCKLHGLESEVGQALNGRIGSVERYDLDAARYVIRLDSGTKDVKSFKVENIKILACGSTAAPPDDDMVGSGSACTKKGRHQWSPEEEQRLLDGFSDLGPHWERIRCNKDLMHLTGLQLKDKHRNLKKS